MLKLESFQPKIVDKEIFANYYEKKDIDCIIKDMGRVSVVSMELESLEEIMNYWQPTGQIGLIEIAEGAMNIHNHLPIGKKAKILKDSIINLKNSCFRNKEAERKFLSVYKEILEDLMQGYKKILKESYKEL